MLRGELEGGGRKDEGEERTDDLSEDVEKTFSDVGCCDQDDGSGEIKEQGVSKGRSRGVVSEGKLEEKGRKRARM